MSYPMILFWLDYFGVRSSCSKIVSSWGEETIIQSQKVLGKRYLLVYKLRTGVNLYLTDDIIGL